MLNNVLKYKNNNGILKCNKNITKIKQCFECITQQPD